jgi:hypothetical protein
MAQKPVDIDVVNDLWEFYREEQSVRHVEWKAKKAGISVSRSTIYRLINKGDRRRGIKGFRTRLAHITKATTQVIDVKHAEAAIANIDGWRQVVDRGIRVVAMLLERAHEKLQPVTMKDAEGNMVIIPLEAKDLNAASNAVKAAFGAARSAAETHEILSVQSGTDADGRDTWIQEHFEEFTQEEHDAFRDRGEWPERLPLPAWFDEAEGKG